MSNIEIVKNKYLKYKNKYLDLKKIFGGAESTNPATLDEWVKYWGNKNFNMKYDISNNIKNIKTKKYNVSNLYIQKGKDNPSKIDIPIFLQFLKDFNITGNLTIVNITIKKLPDLFCNIIIGGDLNLSHIQLRTLPESFRQIKVGGHLNLSHNQLTTLPKSFGNISVHGDLNLSHNQLTTLPKSFGNISVHGDLNLSHNQLTTLPKSFGNILVHGDLNLSVNQLTTLPKSFGNILVHGDLNLSINQLTTLPESFGNMSVHGNLNLSVNQLTTLPNFVNIKIGRNLFLQYNKLEQLPDIFNINIPDDYNITHFIKVNGGLFLNYNKLKTLPESFGNMIVQCDLNLSHNQLKQLPNINYMHIQGKFDLFKNQLYEFPDDFTYIYVNDLNLGENNLRKLPENFVNDEKFKCVGDLNLSHNLLKVLPSNFGEIHVGGDLNLSYNLLKILPTNFEHVGKKILLNNNYIISSSPINCVRNPTQKNYCHLDNQTIEGLESYEENKKCSNCKEKRTCKKCAICKNEDIWYCSEECEKKEWQKSHRHRCNNIINTTFIISAHGVMEHSETPIKDTSNLSIITLSLLGKWTNFYLNEPLSDIYTNNNSLFNDNDKTLTLTDSGNNFNKTYKDSLNVNLTNRLNNKNINFNNILLQFDDTREFVKKLIRNHCFRKYENKENIEKIDDYLYDFYNNQIVNSVDLINHIVDNERSKNYNMGHITFIFIACRGLPDLKDKENDIMRVKSFITQMHTNNALYSDDIVNTDTQAEENEKEKAKDKQKKEELENKLASQLENQFKNSKILIDDYNKVFFDSPALIY